MEKYDMLTAEQKRLIYNEIQEMKEERDYALVKGDIHKVDVSEAALRAIYFVLEVLEDTGPASKPTLWGKESK